MGNLSKIKIQGPFDNEFKKFWLNGGECYYLVDNDIVGCTLHGFLEENDVTSTCGGTKLDFKIEKDEKF